MTSVAIPGRQRARFMSRALRRLRNLAKATAMAALKPHRAALGNLVSMPLTVAGFGCLAAAAVWWQPIVGLASTGVLLIVLELLIADQP